MKKNIPFILFLLLLTVGCATHNLVESLEVIPQNSPVIEMDEVK